VTVLPEAQNCFNLCYKYYGTDIASYVPCVGRCADKYESLQDAGYFNGTLSI